MTLFEKIKRQLFPAPPPSSAKSFSDPSFETAHKGDRVYKKHVDIAQSRLIYASALFAAAFLAISARLVDLTLIQESNETESRPAATASTGITFGRANIVDRNGVLLATSIATASMYANPKEIINIEEAAQKISATLPDLDKNDLRRKLSSGKSFVWLKRNLTPEQHYKTHMLGLPGIGFQREDRRVYPQGRNLAHVLGYTDVDNKGIAGIEKSFDAYLRKNGDALVLSIDSRIQNIMREELSKSIENFNARGGAGIVMDADSGEVLAMVSMPDFDPHQKRGISEDAKFNRATLGVYEMGSTFKIFNTAMALDSGKVRVNDQFDATNPIKIGKHQISDYHPQNRWMNVAEIFEHSSNIGSAKMALTAGLAQQKSFMQKLGLLSPASIELPEIGTPMVPQRWTDVTAMTISFGYGMSVSAIQLVRAVAGVVNGGLLPESTLLKRDPRKPAATTRVISEQTSQNMRQLMRLVVEAGTGKNADVEGYFVGGKTGTAEKSNTGGYAQKKLLSSFVGVFPIQHPKYVVFAVVDEPIGNKASFGYATAAWVSAPVVNRVISRMAPLLGLPPEIARAPMAANKPAANSPQYSANPLKREAVYETQ